MRTPRLFLVGLGALLWAVTLEPAAASVSTVPWGHAIGRGGLAQAPVLPVASRTVSGITDTTRAHIFAALARGDIAAAIAAYEIHAGRTAPEWLLKLQTVYSAAGQKIGQCQEVARTIHAAFIQLNRQPEFIAIRTRGVSNDYMTFDVGGGKALSVTRNGYHAAVQAGERVYDAFTGPAGMKVADYLARLHAPEGVTWKVVSQP